MSFPHADTARETNSQEDRQEGHLRQARDPIRVLHVDDEPTVLTVTSRYLEEAHPAVQVETATDPDEALARIREGSYDCVVCDYDMPGRDGIDVLETVRREDEDLPFILFTGKGSEEVASEAITAGVTDYLQKGPGTEQYDVLLNRIQNAVDRYRLRGRLETFLESAPHAILVAARDGTIKQANARAEEMFGYDERELVGRPVEDLMPERFREVHLAHREDHVEDSETRPTGEDLDLYAKGADGVEFPVDVAVSPVQVGGQVETMVSLRDVSTRMERQRELRERERELAEVHETLRAAIEASPQAIIVVDTEGGVEVWNDAAEEIFGWTEEEVLGEYNPIVPADKEGEFEAWLDDVLAGEPLTGVEATRRTKDGSRITVEISTAAIRDADGNAVGVMGVIEDVTDGLERERTVERERTYLRSFYDVVADPDLD